MSKFINPIKQMLDESNPKKQQTNQLIIRHINFQKIQLQTKYYLEQYISIKILCINNCDLRTLQNFPILNNLIDLDLSNNSLQGTFQYLIKNKKLQYINISDNFIPDVNKLLPLKRIKGLSICLKNNPLIFKDGWANKLKTYSIKLLKQPKKISFSNQKKQNMIKCKEKQKQKQKDRQILPMIQLKPPSIIKNIDDPFRKSPVRLITSNKSPQFKLQGLYSQEIESVSDIIIGDENGFQDDQDEDDDGQQDDDKDMQNIDLQILQSLQDESD